jgi:hypothetical protein
MLRESTRLQGGIAREQSNFAWQVIRRLSLTCGCAARVSNIAWVVVATLLSAVWNVIRAGLAFRR